MALDPGPGNGSGNDSSSIELALRSKIKDGTTKDFREKTSGKITGVKLRETDQGPDVYLVSLWSSGGVLLSSASTDKDLVDGWHVATFPEPVPAVAEDRYSVVYWASPKHTQPKAARGENVVIQWASDGATSTADPTTTASATPTPSESSSDAPSDGGSTPTSDIPLLPTFPNASNTGVPSGTSLKTHSGDWTITKPGTVIDGYDVDGVIQVRANDVVIKNSRIRGSSWWSIRIMEDLTGVVVQDCDIDGQGATGQGILGPVKALRNDISNVSDGAYPGSGSLLQDNYIHDLAGSEDSHFDGFQINGDCENVTMLHNTVLNQYTQTSAVIIGNPFGPVDNIRVENNYLAGGGYTVYSVVKPEGSGAITGVAFINNTLGRGHWGYASIKGNTPVIRGNIDAETGESVTF